MYSVIAHPEHFVVLSGSGLKRATLDYPCLSGSFTLSSFNCVHLGILQGGYHKPPPLRSPRTNIIPRKQIRAITFDPRIQLQKLHSTNTLALLNCITTIPTLHQIILVAIRYNARLLRLWSLRRWRRSFRCCTGRGTRCWRTRDSNAVIVSKVELRAIGIHRWIPGDELRNSEGSVAVGDNLACVAGDGFIVFCAGRDDTALGWSWTGGGCGCGAGGRTCGWGSWDCDAVVVT